jgi:hypothetical protein
VVNAAADRQLAEKIIAELSDASQSLSDERGTAAALEFQKTAVNDMEALLQRLRDSARQTPPPDAASSPSPSSRQASSGSQAGGQPNANRDAAQASEGAEGGESQGMEELVRRRDLAQSVWGHLPPKMQEELRRSFSEQFAPKDEDLIRRYYEALARQPRPMRGERGPSR